MGPERILPAQQFAFTSDPNNDNTYAIGDEVLVQVTFSTDVTVTGSPPAGTQRGRRGRETGQLLRRQRRGAAAVQPHGSGGPRGYERHIHQCELDKLCAAVESKLQPCRGVDLPALFDEIGLPHAPDDEKLTKREYIRSRLEKLSQGDQARGAAAKFATRYPVGEYANNATYEIEELLLSQFIGRHLIGHHHVCGAGVFVPRCPRMVRKSGRGS